MHDTFLLGSPQEVVSSDGASDDSGVTLAIREARIASLVHIPVISNTNIRGLARAVDTEFASPWERPSEMSTP